jgi:hypothetical protein
MTKQSMGGKARAVKLSPENRSRIASQAARSRWSRRGQVVYVIGPDVGPQKIGISINPTKRLGDIKKGVTGDISVVAVVDPGDRSAAEIEMRAHWLLRGQRLSGEWFDVTRDEAVSAVNQALEEATRGTAQKTDEPTVAVTFRMHESLLKAFKERHGKTWRLQMQHVVTLGAENLPDPPARAPPSPVKPKPHVSRLKGEWKAP